MEDCYHKIRKKSFKGVFMVEFLHSIPSRNVPPQPPCRTLFFNCETERILKGNGISMNVIFK